MQITLHKKYFAWMFFFLSFLNFLMHSKYIVRFDNIFRNSEIYCLCLIIWFLIYNFK